MDATKTQWFLVDPVLRTAILAATLWAAALAPAVAAPEDDYNLAVGLYKKERWDEAATAFHEFLRENPDHQQAALARLYRGLALVNAGDHAAARDELREFVRRYPTNRNLPDALYRIGEASYSLGDYPQAERDLRTFLDRYPEHELTEWALPYLADAQLRLNKPDEAAQNFQRAIEAHPQGRLVGEAKFGLARAYEALQRPDDAMTFYRELAAGTGTRAAPAQLRVATLLYDAGRFSEAATEFIALADRFPQNRLVGTARLNAGFALYRAGEHEKAVEQLEAAAQDAAQAATAKHWIGMAHKALGDYPAAAAAFKAVDEQHGDSPLANESRFQWADAALRAGHYDEALRLFEQVVASDPNGPQSAEALHFAGEAALLSGDLERATALIEQFRRDHGRSAFRMHNRLLAGRVLEARAAEDGATPEQQDQWERDALREYTTVLDETEIDATKAKARFQIARLREKRGEHDETLRVLAPLLKEVERQGADSPYLDALIIAARTRLAQNEPQAAASAATTYLELAPQGDQADAALAVRAVAHLAAGRPAEAKDDLTALRERFPQSDLLLPTTQDLAERAYDRQDWSAAADFFATLVELAPGRPEEAIGLSGLGWSRHKAGEFPQAAAAFGRLLERFPEAPQLAPEAAYMKGKSLQDAGDLAAAADAYRAAFARFAPAEPAATGAEVGGPLRNAYLAGLQLARVLRLQSKTDEADAAYANLVAKFPRPRNLDELLDEWALLHYEAGDFDKADELFKRILAETPTGPVAANARLSLAESALFSGRLEDAKTEFERLADDPQAAESTRQRAHSLLVSLAAERGDWQTVESLATSFLERHRESRERPVVLYQLGEALLQQARPDRAAEVLAEVEALQSDTAVRAETWFPRVYVLLAEADFQRKNYDAAIQRLEQVTSWQPRPDYAYLADELLGRIAKNRARFDEARAAFQRVLDDPQARRTATAARAQYEIAQTYFLQQRWEEARTAAFKVYTLYKYPEWQAPALYMAALADEALGEKEKAAAAFADVIREFPETEYAAQAREKLARLNRPKG